MMSFKSYLFQASILVLLVVLCMTPSDARLHVKASSKIIDRVCSKALDRSYCMQFLGSTPGAATADLKGLAKITINLARSNGVNTLARLLSLLPKTTNPALKEGYVSCSKHYDKAIDGLQNSRRYLDQGNYVGMSRQATDGEQQPADCDDEIKVLGADPSILKGNQDLKQMYYIIFVIANLLRGLN